MLFHEDAPFHQAQRIFEHYETRLAAHIDDIDVVAVKAVDTRHSTVPFYPHLCYTSVLPAPRMMLFISRAVGGGGGVANVGGDY